MFIIPFYSISKSECVRQLDAPYKLCQCTVVNTGELKKNMQILAHRSEIERLSSSSTINTSIEEPCQGVHGLRYCAIKCRSTHRNRLVITIQ
jgi:hypothetical protein